MLSPVCAAVVNMEKPGIRRGCWSRSKTSLMIILPRPSGLLPTYTSAARLAIRGGSNGGLLVAA